MDHLQAFWAIVVVPCALAIASVYGFAKVFRENQKLQLEIDKLKRELAATESRIYRPSHTEIDRYGHPTLGRERLVPWRVMLPALIGGIGLGGLFLISVGYVDAVRHTRVAAQRYEFEIDELRRQLTSFAATNNALLNITSTEGRVFVDGVQVGRAPGSFAISPGQHQVRLERPLVGPVVREIAVAAGETVTLSAWR
jgi:hypothetical protein